MSNNTAIYLYVAVSIIAIGILSGFLIDCNNKPCSPYTYLADTAPYPDDPRHRDLCLCSGTGRKLCANKQELLSSYEQGNNESQDFAANQKANGGARWRTSDFDNYALEKFGDFGHLSGIRA